MKNDRVEAKKQKSVQCYESWEIILFLQFIFVFNSSTKKDQKIFHKTKSLKKTSLIHFIHHLLL